MVLKHNLYHQWQLWKRAIHMNSGSLCLFDRFENIYYCLDKFRSCIIDVFGTFCTQFQTYSLFWTKLRCTLFLLQLVKRFRWSETKDDAWITIKRESFSFCDWIRWIIVNSWIFYLSITFIFSGYCLLRIFLREMGLFRLFPNKSI